MSHYAKVANGKVVNVIVAEEDFFQTFVDNSPGIWVQTSYNTRGNVHYAPNSNEPDGLPPLRGNYAIIGGIYDAENDVFYENSPWPSWKLNTTTWLWEAPVPKPDDGNFYYWDEDSLSWKLLEPPQE